MIKKMTEEEILKAVKDGSMNWLDISCESLSEKFIEKHFDKLSKSCISEYQKLSEKFIGEHFDELNMYYISEYQKLSEKFIEKHFDELDKICISIYQHLSEEFIEKHFDKLHKYWISKHQKLSEEFIEKHFDKLHKGCISQCQKLSEEFIEKHFDKLNKDYIAEYQYLSLEFRQKHNLPLPEDSWMYWTREEKEKYIKENTEYEVKDGKVIAYKSCREDGYSVYNFQYHYEVGKEYSSHCDYNANEDNSFGLSAWSKEGALEYHNKGKLFKVEIDLDDLGCITDEDKIRCRKMRIINEIKD